MSLAKGPLSVEAGFMLHTHEPGKGLDPRVVIGLFLSIAIWITSCRTPAGTALWAVLSVGCVWWLRHSGRIAPGSGAGLLRWVIPMALLVAAMYSLLMTGEGRPLAGYGPIHITVEGATTGVKLGLRLVAFAGLAAAMTMLIIPSRLAAGATRFLLPLRRVGLQVAAVYFLMFFMFRMFPILSEELQTIRLGQRSRGLRFDGPWRTRIRASTALLIPAFAAALRRADRLSMALASRGFDVRRVPREVLLLRLRRRDWLVLFLMVGGWAAWITGRLLPCDLVLF